VKEKVFTKAELKEIRTYKSKPLPEMPQDLLIYLGSYRASTISDLRILVSKSEPWHSPYDRQRDFDRDWIKSTVYNLLRKYEANSLEKDHLEMWFIVHIWSFVDRAFENIEGVEVVRGESCSRASSLRKNRNRTVDAVNSMPRKQMGRRGDLIIRRMSTEYGCGEAGRVFEGENGTKILREGGLKTPKMLKDQFDNLCTCVESSEEKVRSLETIGFIHAGLSVLLLRLDSPAGYTCRISRTKMLTFPSTISEFGTKALPIILLAWKAKKIVSNVIKTMEQNDDDEDSLEALQNSCENNATPPSTPRRKHEKITFPTCSDTPSKSKRKVKLISNAQEGSW